MYAEVPFEQQIARSLPESQALQLHILPGHQELIAPLPTGYVGPVMTSAEAWLKHHGYRTLGPWMISWGPNGQPQLRRPVSGALKAVRDKDFQTVEVPEQLLVAVPFVGWPILPHNFTPAITAVGLEVTGSPLLLALTNDPPTTAWIPVVPQGTSTLFPGNRDKIGLNRPPPKAGQVLPQIVAWHSAFLTSARFVTVMSMLVIMLTSFSCVALMLAGEAPLLGVDLLGGSMLAIFGAIFFQSFIFYWCVLPLCALWVIIGLFKMNAVAHWNRFWEHRPPPPELLLGSRGEGSVGAWLG